MPDSAPSTIAPGDLVALADDEGARILLRAQGGPQKVKGVGILSGEKLVGTPWGARLEHGSKTFLVLRPGIGDLHAGIARKAQIILPKDASRILYECDVHEGSRVVEAGIGSGALTTALAWAVGDAGRVHTYELRDDFAQWGVKNLEQFGFAHRVDVKVGNVTQGVQERDVDAFILDMPTPWDAVPVAREALRASGHFCAYTPLVSQVEQTHRALREHAFADIRTIELMERAWIVHEHGARPSFDMLGHTAFLTFARKTA